MANVYMGTDVEEFIFGEGTMYESCKKEEVEDTPAAEEEEKVEESVVEEEVVEEEVEVTAEEMNMFGVIECVDEQEVACYRIALENEMNYNAVMNAFMVKEFTVLESTGSEMVYEAADVKQFFELVKKTLAKWWAKIQGVFKNVMDSIAKLVSQDERFIKKYEKADIVKPEVDKKFQGFDFGKRNVPDYDKVAGEVRLAVQMGIKNLTMLAGDKAKEYVETFNKDFAGVKDKMRGDACGKGGSVKEEDFEKELKIGFFGSEEKVDIELKSFAELINELKHAKMVKARVKGSYKKAEASVKELHKEIKNAEGRFLKLPKDPNMGIAKCLTDSVNASLRIMSKAISMDTKAMMVELRQNRAMAAFYVTNQPKKEVKAESAVDDLGVVLI